MPPTVKPSRWATAVLATVSVVRIASAASAPPSAEAGGADPDLGGGGVEQFGEAFGGGVGVLEAERPGAGVGSAGVEDHGVQGA
jgi:hypothetical protein